MQEPERMVSAGGVELCTQSFGDPARPAVLLVMGASSSMLWWPDDFCRQLAAAGRYVVRYDHRDTGRSTCYEPGPPPYDLDELARDAVRVLDAYGIARADIVGMSLGGMIAQLVALRSPDRVATLTMIASSSLAPDDPDLPGIAPAVLAHLAAGDAVDWSSEAAAVTYMVDGWRLMSGSARAFDEDTIRGIARAEFRRARRLVCMRNHALLTGGEVGEHGLAGIAAPALVIHGTEDPVLPYAHGIALAASLPRSTLVGLRGVGHEIHREDWGAIVDAVATFTQP